MRILMINSFFSVGGPPRIMNGIYETLIRNGHECMIAAAREKMYAPEHSIQIGTKFSVYINALKARLFDNEGFCAKRETKTLINRIKDYNPDVIFLHNLHGYYINIEILFEFLKSYKRKVIWLLHDCWAFTGHCTHFSIVKCVQWQDHCVHCMQTRCYPSCLSKGNVYRNFDRKRDAFRDVKDMTIVTPSAWLADIVRKSFLKSYNVIVNHNRIDTNVFHPVELHQFVDEYHLKDKTILLGVAQNWGKSKGLDDFISLSMKLDDRYKIILVGLTHKQKESLPKNIIGIQRTESIEQLVEIYSSADLFINLTYEDNFPTVNLEALACGIPVLTYQTGGSPEAIDENSGFVVEQGDLNSVINIIKNYKGREYYKENCVRRAYEFSLNNVKEDFYLALLK